MATQDEKERAAKVYQVDAVESRVKAVETFLSTLDIKMDRLLDNQVTSKQLEEKLETAIREIHLEYGPMKNNITWFTRAVILEGLVIAGQIIVTLSLLANKG